MYQPRARIALLALLFGACGPTSKHHGDAGVVDGGADATVDTAPLPHTLTGLDVTPTNPLIELDLNADGSQGFSVTGHFLDGVDEDVTSQVTWAVMNPNVGAMSGSTLLIPAFATATAETSLITATLGGVEGKAQITVVAYRKSGTQQDFFFILPYQDPAGLQNRPLDFSTTIPALDVFFLMDTTGSMYGEIHNLQTALTGTVIPGIQSAVANSQFGVGALEDFPLDGYGSVHGSDCGRGGESAPDQPFKLRQAITNNVTAVQTAVNGLALGTNAPIGCGEDWPEGGLEAIYQAATGEGLTSPSPTSVPANHTGIGGVAFRSGTMPVIVDITDAMTHGVGETGSCNTGLTVDQAVYSGSVATVAHSRAQTKTALANICARVVGISAIQTSLPANCSGEEYMRDLATATGARVPPAAWDVGVRPTGCGPTQCCTGQNGAGMNPDGDGLCPVVFDVAPNGTGVSTNIVTGIQMLARFATFDVPTDKQGAATDVDGNPLPSGTTTADFIKAVTPTSFVLPPPPPNLPNPTFDTTTFHNVTPGTQVSFSVNAYNDFVPATDKAQIFRATIRVLAGGCTPLDQRDVLILVPPNPIVIE
jgi:hypothetical protein